MKASSRLQDISGAPKGSNALIGTVLAKVFGTKNEREVKRLMPLVEQINALEPEIQKLSDEQLRAKTAEFKSAVRQYLVGELGDEVAAKLSAKKLSKTAVAEVDE